MKQRRLLLLGLVLLMLAVIFLWPSERRKVEKRVRAAAAAVEGERIIDLASCLSRDYSDASGMSYEEVLGAAKMVFDRFDGIKIHFEMLRARVEKNRATADVRVRVEGKDRSGADLASYLERFGGGGQDELAFTIGLRKGSQGWRIDRIDRTGD